MNVRLLATTVLVAASSLSGAVQNSTMFNPVGKWTVSTVTDEGVPMTVRVSIAGRPGAFTGEALTSENRSLPLREIGVTPSGMVALFDLPQGAIIVRLVRGADGKYSGAWGEVEQTYALTAVKDASEPLR
jgi:hypothetical protein